MLDTKLFVARAMKYIIMDGVRPQLLFLYVPAVSNVVTYGNGMDTKRNRALGFRIQSSVYGAITVAKVSLFSTWTRSTVSFYSM